MSLNKPLILDQTTGKTKQNPPRDDLDIPINERVDALELQMAELARLLFAQGFELPEELEELL